MKLKYIAISAIIGFLFFPEIFSSLAIFFTYNNKENFEGKQGLYLMILSIASLIVGLYVTSLLTVGSILFA